MEPELFIETHHVSWLGTEPPAEEGEARAVTCLLGLTFQAHTGMGHRQKHMGGIGSHGDRWGQHGWAAVGAAWASLLEHGWGIWGLLFLWVLLIL